MRAQVTRTLVELNRAPMDGDVKVYCELHDPVIAWASQRSRDTGQAVAKGEQHDGTRGL